MNRKTLIRIATFFIILLFNIIPCQAQSKIKLNDIRSFEFIRQGGGLSNYDYHLEVIRDNNSWKSYQTRLTRPDGVNKTQHDAKIYMKDIAAGTLKGLLNKLSKPVTEINLKLFNINQTELIRDLDSIEINFEPGQKLKLNKAIHSKEVLNRVVYQILHPIPMDDQDYYAIKITLKQTKHLQ